MIDTRSPLSVVRRPGTKSKSFLRGFAVKSFLVLGFICVFLCSSAANVSGQVLTSGADFLKIDSGARSEGMGGAFTAVADDVNALTWNPAGIASLQYPEIGYLRMLYFSDIAYNFGGAAFPMVMGEDTFGLGAGVVNTGTSFDSTLGLAPAVSTGDNAFFLTTALRLKSVFAIGFTGKYIMRQIANYNASAIGGDAGILITPGDRFRLGLGIFNVGSQVKFISEGDPLPMTGRLGLAFKILDVPHNSILLSVDNSYQFGAQAYQASAGAEYWLDKTLALRAGYAGDAYQQHWTAGIGINAQLFQLDYAYAPAGTLGDTHRLSFILRFGTEEAATLLAPAGFTAKPLDEAVGLSWTPSAAKEVIGYNLYVKRPGADHFARITQQPVKDTVIKLKHLQNGMNYSFAVASVSAAGRESSVAELSIVPGEAKITAPVLQAPTGFKASLAPQGSGVSPVVGLLLTLDKAPLGDVAGFNLYTADEDGKIALKLSAQPILNNQVVLTKINADRLYRLVLTSVGNSGVESEPTSVLVIKVSDLQKAMAASLIPAAPAHLMVEGGDGLASLSWDKVEGAVGYHIYSSDDGKVFKRLTANGPKDIQKVVLKALKNGKTYYFGISSVTADGTEGDKTVQAVIPAAPVTK